MLQSLVLDYISAFDSKVRLSIRGESCEMVLSDGMPQVFVKDTSLVG